MGTDDTNRPQVVIVGAGPSGLALAIELGSRSIPCLLIERSVRAGWAPRAKTTHNRTREHLRRWGIAEKVAQASPFGIDYPTNITFVTRLSGPKITTFKHALGCSPAKDERYAEHGQWIPQYKLEAVLREHAASLEGVTITFGEEFVSFEQDDAAVRIRLRTVETGEERIVEADFLVGADGARSAVREAIGAKMIGKYGLSRNYNTIFRAPGLREAHKHGDAIMIWQINSDTPSVLGMMDQGDLWYFMPTNIGPDVKYSNEEMLELIRRATGFDLPYEILSSDEWVASALIADRYSDGRVFLTGDACHLHPPFGGYGMNMGIADSVDLGWKIAAHLQGWGTRALLNSYEAERRPTHQFVVDEAAANHAVLPHQLVRDHLEDDSPKGKAVRQSVAKVIRKAKRSEFYSMGVTLGYRYQNSPLIAYDADDSWTWSREYEPSAAPGCRAPHHWLDDGRSLYDLFGQGFTLLVFADIDGADIAKAWQESTRLEVPFKVVKLENAELAARYEATRALIRPDQHVAWRGDEWAPGLLSLVTGQDSERALESGDARAASNVAAG